MPNFTAKIRTNYQDMDGLVLDCRHNDLADDGSIWINRAPSARSTTTGVHTGGNGSATLVDALMYWPYNSLAGKVVYNLTDGSSGIISSNTTQEAVVTLSGGTDNDWDDDDQYLITGPRFGNPYQDVVAQRPVVSTVGSYKQAAFTRANSHNFKIPLDYSFLASTWTVAYEYTQGASSSNQQTIISFPDFYIQRRNASGNYEYKTNLIYRSGLGDMASGLWLLTFYLTGTARLYRNNSLELSDTASVFSIDAGDPAGRIGSLWSGAQYGEMTLRTMQIWNRRVSPLEIDFAFKTLSPETDYALLDRPEMERRVWTDETATVSRINPSQVASHKFIVAIMDGAGRVQISAQVNGNVLPDSELGGELFSLTPIELPTAVVPGVYQDSGWSSVFDILITEVGHYTYLLSRQNGGGVILHFDAELEGGGV